MNLQLRDIYPSQRGLLSDRAPALKRVRAQLIAAPQTSAMSDIRPRPTIVPNESVVTPRPSTPVQSTGSQRLTSSDDQLDQNGIRRAIALRNALKQTHNTLAQTYNQAKTTNTREISEVNAKAARKIRPPSTTRYSLFIGLSLVVDILISPLITAAWATIILGILATIVLAILMAIAGRVLLGSNAKRASKHREELEQRAKELERDIQLVRQEYQSFVVWLGAAGKRFPGLAARAGTAVAKVGRLAEKYNVVKYAGKMVNWLKKGWFKQGSEAIPIWNVLPWWTIGAVAAYLSHRGDYKEAQAVLAAYNNRSVETMSIRDNLNEARLAVVREAFVEAGAQASRIAQSGAPALGAAHS